MKTQYIESYEKADGFNGHTCAVHICKNSSGVHWACWLTDAGISSFYMIGSSDDDYAMRRKPVRIIK